MIDTLSLPAPAKINRFLHITGRRPDGYHEIQTAFQFLNRCDRLHFRLRSDSAIHLHGDTSYCALKDNLIYRAALALQAHCTKPQGIDITLEKYLPIGGGLGGGSSNAATTLLALNTMMDLNLSRKQLSDIAHTLGADVPIFILGHAAWGEGIGERLTPLTLDEAWAVLMIPACTISTKAIYQSPELPRNTPRLLQRTQLPPNAHNDCEALVRQYYPQVDHTINWLNQFSPAQMTGTGACIFAIFASQQEAEAVLAQIPENFGGFVARCLNRSPLHNALAIVQLPNV